MKSGKRHMAEEIELPNQGKIRMLGEKVTYKYLGILEADTIKQVEMKEKIKTEYIRSIGLAVIVFTKVPGDKGSFPGRIMPKTPKMVLDISLLKTQHYKVWIKGKVKQPRTRSSAPTLHLGIVAFEKGAFKSPSITVTNLLLYQVNEKTPRKQTTW